MADLLLRTLRCRNDHRPGVLGRLATAIGSTGANIGDIRTVWVGPDHIVRDLDVLVEDASTLEKTLAVVNELDGVEVIDVIDDVHEFHIDGKIEVARHPPGEAASTTCGGSTRRAWPRSCAPSSATRTSRTCSRSGARPSRS